MPKYFFNVSYGDQVPDTVGEEFSNHHDAWCEAVDMAGQNLRDIDGQFQIDREWRLEVTDEFLTPLFVIHVNAEKVR
jgi:hypothetical protein